MLEFLHVGVTLSPTVVSKSCYYQVFILLQQLQQLHRMGITDEATCLHALEATNGNLEAALELLL